MIEYISKAEAAAIRRALAKLILEKVETSFPGLTEESLAAVQTGGVEAVRAVLKEWSDKLTISVDDLVMAARAEIDALPGVVIPDEN